MKRINHVILYGQIDLKRIYTIRRLLAVEILLSTDLEVLGGSHRVVCESDLALETLAFVLTAMAHKEPLTATVHGWLWSGEKQAHVVAHEVDFHVATLLREQAVAVIKQLRKTENALPQWVSVNGWKVNIHEMLADGVEISGGLV